MELDEDLLSVARAKAFNYTSQQKDAQAVYEKIKQDPKFKGYEIQTTGQSLGGYLAQYIAAKNNLKSATFNAFHGTQKALQEEANKSSRNLKINSGNIINYRNKEDFLSKGSTKNNIGVSLETHAKIKQASWNKIEEPHMSENMGSLENTRKTNENYNYQINAKTGLVDRLFSNTRNFVNNKLNQ